MCLKEITLTPVRTVDGWQTFRRLLHQSSREMMKLLINQVVGVVMERGDT